MKSNSLSIKCNKLNLRLGDTIVFSDFSFEFTGPGIVFIEGENGAGKSALLKVLAGFIIPKSGSITFSDKLIEDFKILEVSYLNTSSIGLLEDLTGLDHIIMLAKIYNLNDDDIKKNFDRFYQLDIFEKILSKKVCDFSQGMKQLLRLFLHLFFEPCILFLDEPFLYLSPKIKSFLEAFLEDMAQKSLIFITDQSFSWKPETKNILLKIGEK